MEKGSPFGIVKNHLFLPNSEPAAFQAVFVKETGTVFYMLVVLVKRSTGDDLLKEHRKGLWRKYINVRADGARCCIFEFMKKKKMSLHGADRIKIEVRELVAAKIFELADRAKLEIYMQKEAKRMAKVIKLGMVVLPGMSVIKIKGASP